MARITFEQKLDAIFRVEKGDEGITSIARSLNFTNTELIHFWIGKYNLHGPESLKKSYTRYSIEDKLYILNYMNENRLSDIETAVHFNLPTPGTIRKWRISLKNLSVDTLFLKEKGHKQLKKDNSKKGKNQNFKEGSLEALRAENEQLRMENAFFKKVEFLSSREGKIKTKDLAQVVFELRIQFNIKELIKLAGIKRSTYYYWTSRFDQPDKYDNMKSMISTIYHDHKGRYGYRRITLELRNQGFLINHKTVQRLMKEMGLKSLVRIKKYRSYKGSVGKIAPNILSRKFIASKPNEKWVTDITEFHLFGEKIYLSPVLDLFNGEIIAYNIQSRPTYKLVSIMLDKALFCLSEGDAPILHSDQGWHYQMKEYSNALKQNGITLSMSRKGNCLDNAVIENFFGLLKSELLYMQEFESMNHFKLELELYIEYYNHKRIKGKLKGLSPVQYRIQSSEAA
ncbi:IS3 family transposase [Lysinibacillus fusiformis]|uniref:IS3 family transposase n=1 Tax=Lysinibacillus fusiformis TaxID=28031 RepID=UPI0011873D9F|nr:IS3 family transposase [Lysinibacillus fusiformis]UXJ66799.1 IS3 family transposase [Lysinibacillus fusiformis]UXJ66890.1 IS3 family transposase [Lysinibacillus fusiformis]UXJ69497.1 IS3 family transposase [Lysinibacillus fusiformis]